MSEVTKNGRVSIADSQREQSQRTEKEREDLRLIGEEAIKEVRETLLRQIDQYEPKHREMILFTLNN